MKNAKQSPVNSYSQQREQVRSVITIAVFSVIITGGLALLFCFDVLSLFTGELNYTNLFTYEIDWIRLCIYILIALALSITVGYLIIRKSFIKRTMDLAQIPDASEDLADEVEVEEFKTSESMIAQELDAEKRLNNLLWSMLRINAQDTETDNTKLMQSFGSVCKSDFLGYYTSDDKSNVYSLVSTWDKEPEFARHSNKLTSLELTDYQLLQESLIIGKPVLFRAAMLDELLTKTEGAADDARQWMQNKVLTSAEYKFCKNEAWNYLIALPCNDKEKLAGIFVLGYFGMEKPLQSDEMEKLTVLSNALHHQFNNPYEAPNNQQSYESLNSAIANLCEAIIVTDTEGKILLANPAAIALKADRSLSIIDKHWTDAFQMIDVDSRLPIPDPVQRIYRDLSANVLIKNAMLLTNASMEVEIEGMAAPIHNNRNEITGIIFIIRDITDVIFEQNERLKMHKLEAISSLSAGLAHDFNNILTTILASISLALDDAPPGSDQAMMLKTAEESTLKGKEITDKLLTFAKSSPQSETSTDIAKDIELITQRLINDTNVKASYSIEKNLPAINMSASAFGTILTNLLKNSLEAMNNTGSLTVSAETFNHLENNNLPLKKGQYLLLKVQDYGHGISRENLSRIFVPYFTTHQGNKGLGLSTINSLLVKHNGYIHITSPVGKGTTCEVYIPVANGVSTSIPEPVKAEKPALPLALILDEDDALTNLMVKIVSNHGFKVLKTSDPHELKELFDSALKHSEQVALVIADINTPSDIDLLPMISTLKQDNKEQKLIAYGNNLLTKDFEQYQKLGFDDILTKPFNVNDLEALIKRNFPH